ncbi:MAG: hypothetical protein A2Y16_05530 [Tenericutes bacterium GWF2_57_13]|nr:MAG: hypothetical protein A2Y16_05530 [Tenericutes bacterium GWF2_57_13]
MGSNYYLKSDRDVFKKHYIKLIRHRQFGNDFYALYDVMLHESIDHNGELRNSETLPFDDGTLCMVAFGDCIIGPKDIKHFTQIVHDGLILFKELGLVEIKPDGTIYMGKLPDKLGSSSSERVKRHRDKVKASCNANETLQKRECNVTRNADVTLQNVSCNSASVNDIDLLKSLDIRDKEEPKGSKKNVTFDPLNAVNYRDISQYWNTKMAGRKIPKIHENMTSIRKGHVNARIADYGIAKIYEMIDRASESDFLAGMNDRGWMANFDWCLLPTNFAKIIENNYKNGGNSNGNAISGKPSAKPEFARFGTTV